VKSRSSSPPANAPDQRFAQVGLNQPSFAFRLGAPFPHRPLRAGDIALVRINRAPSRPTGTLFAERCRVAARTCSLTLASAIALV
jgi:hypothetical protein